MKDFSFDYGYVKYHGNYVRVTKNFENEMNFIRRYGLQSDQFLVSTFENNFPKTRLMDGYHNFLRFSTHEELDKELIVKVIENELSKLFPTLGHMILKKMKNKKFLQQSISKGQEFCSSEKILDILKLLVLDVIMMPECEHLKCHESSSEIIEPLIPMAIIQ